MGKNKNDERTTFINDDVVNTRDATITPPVYAYTAKTDTDAHNGTNAIVPNVNDLAIARRVNWVTSAAR